MQIAQACDHPESVPAELRPTAAMCEPYYDAKQRGQWDGIPLCADLEPTPKSICQDKEWVREAVRDLANCLDEPLARAGCAVALHPGTIADLSAACPGIYTAALEEARKNRSIMTAMWIGGAAATVGLILYLRAR
jgi:hypothetical protein